LLDPGLPAVNPLDAWSAGGPDADDIMAGCLSALMADPGTAIGAVVHDRAPQGRIYPHYADYLRKGHAASGKPTFLVSNRQGTGSDPRVVAWTREGFPVLDGLRSFLAGVKCLFDYRDFTDRSDTALPVADTALCSRWRKRLAEMESPNEYEGMKMLRDFGLPVNPAMLAGNADQVCEAAGELGFPLVLKTARPDLVHKTDHGGVVLDIHDRDELLKAYGEMSTRLGADVQISPMLTHTGVEMMLGMVRDEQFGPLVMLGFGGVNVEVIRDVAYALPPFDKDTAWRLIDDLHARALLDGVRGSGPLAVDQYCNVAARFSAMVAALDGVLDEVDINPLIVHTGGCVAVDSLVVPRRSDSKDLR
jgi:acyl-CoA synthetase (NDP forming)